MSHAIQPMPLEPDDNDLAIFAFLARYTGLTRRSYTTDLKHYLGWCADRSMPPLAAKRVHIEIYLRECEQRGLAPATVAHKAGTLNMFYRYAVVDEYIEANPAAYVRRPPVPKESQTLGLSHLEFEAVLVAARERPMDHALVALLGLLGLRVSTACAADIEGLSVTHGHRTLAVVSKGGKPLLKPMPPMVARAVDVACGTRTAGPVLLSAWGDRMTRQVAARAVDRIARNAGIKHHISPHSLRHTFVTTMLDAGVDLRDVQIAADHAEPRTTMRYDRARANLDRSGIYALAAYMSGAA